MNKLTHLAAATALAATVPLVGAAVTALPASALPCHPRYCPDPPPPPPPHPPACPDLEVGGASDPVGGGGWGQNHQRATVRVFTRRTLTSGVCVDASAYLTATTHTWTTLALAGFHTKTSVAPNPPGAYPGTPDVTGSTAPASASLTGPTWRRWTSPYRPPRRPCR
ncbi:MAG: hypothetical protein ABI890_06800 [Lapillicoccus sp.]